MSKYIPSRTAVSLALVAPLLVSGFVVAAPATAAPAVAPEAGPSTAPHREVKREVRIIRMDGAGEQKVITENVEGDLRLDGLPPLSMGSGRALLGVMPAPAEANAGEKGAPGVGILEVTPGGGAAKAGLKAGDRIVSVGGRVVGTPEELLASMDGAKAGVPLKVEILRDGKPSTVEVTPQTREMRVMVFRHGPQDAGVGADGAAGQGDDEADLPPGHGMLPPGHGMMPPGHGMMGRGHGMLPPDMGMPFHHGRGPGRQAGPELATLTATLGKYFGTDKGVLVVAARDSLKLQDGDVLQAIGGRAVTDEAQAHRILRSYAPGETVPLAVLRDRKAVKLEAVVPEPKRFKVEMHDDGDTRVRVKVMERNDAP